MNELACIGDFCPNPDCEDDDKIVDNQSIRYRTRDTFMGGAWYWANRNNRY